MLPLSNDGSHFHKFIQKLPGTPYSDDGIDAKRHVLFCDELAVGIHGVQARSDIVRAGETIGKGQLDGLSNSFFDSFRLCRGHDVSNNPLGILDQDTRGFPGCVTHDDTIGGVFAIFGYAGGCQGFAVEPARVAMHTADRDRVVRCDAIHLSSRGPIVDAPVSEMPAAAGKPLAPFKAGHAALDQS